MLKNPIPQVTNRLQNRAIGIINGKFIPNDSEKLNRGFLIDIKGEKMMGVCMKCDCPCHCNQSCNECGCVGCTCNEKTNEDSPS